jgi:hypothetical protein
MKRARKLIRKLISKRKRERDLKSAQKFWELVSGDIKDRRSFTTVVLESRQKRIREIMHDSDKNN